MLNSHTYLNILLFLVFDDQHAILFTNTQKGNANPAKLGVFFVTNSVADLG